MNYKQFCNYYVWEVYGNNAISKAWELYKQILHALWMARALRAGAEANRCSVCRSHAHRVCSNNIRDYFNLKYKKWCWAERKCLEKAKEFE